MLKSKRRFLIAGVIPFLCIFSQTLLQYNAVFALGGMVNHTLADWEEWLDLPSHRTRAQPSLRHGPHTRKGTCMLDRSHNQGHFEISDGPFPWDSGVEGLINAIISVGMMVGTLMTLFVYDYLNGRLVFAVSLSFPGILNILTPEFARRGGYFTTVIFRFFTGLYTAVLTPVIPALVNSWFLPTELYKMNIIIFLGQEIGRMVFCFTGNMVENFGWEFLFYFPGIFSVIIGLMFYLVMTDDPLQNHFLHQDEKLLLATAYGREYKPSVSPPQTANQPVRQKLSTRIRKYKRNMTIKKDRVGDRRVPWRQIFMCRMLWVATLQAMGQAWSSVMMILMNKEYLEEIHGYSLKEAAVMVTIPNNVAQFFIGLATGVLGDLLIKKNVPSLTVRRLGAVGQILAVIPMSVLPFLPCEVVEYRSVMVTIQILSSFRVVGNLAGYSSYRDISPAFQRHLFGVSSIISQCVPGIMVPALMGILGTTSRDQWRVNYSVNCSVVAVTNLIYCICVSTSPAEWDHSCSSVSDQGLEVEDTGSFIEKPGHRPGRTSRLLDSANNSQLLMKPK